MVEGALVVPFLLFGIAVDRSSTEWDEKPSSDEDESGFGWDDR